MILFRITIMLMLNHYFFNYGCFYPSHHFIFRQYKKGPVNKIWLSFDYDTIDTNQIISIHQTRFRGNVPIKCIALQLLKIQVPSCRDNIISVERCFSNFRSFYRKLKLKYKNDNILRHNWLPRLLCFLPNVYVTKGIILLFQFL